MIDSVFNCISRAMNFGVYFTVILVLFILAWSATVTALGVYRFIKERRAVNFRIVLVFIVSISFILAVWMS